MQTISSLIIPAVIPTSRAELIALAQELSFAAEIHVDMVDGDFVPSVSWPYEPVGQPVTVKEYLDTYSLEVDLMVADPVSAAAAWLEAGADMLVFHTETIPLEAFKRFRASCSVTLGISSLNDTPIETLLEYAEHADYVQVMGIATIGSQGQSFDERVLERIKVLREAYPQLPISIDGSVNLDTLPRLAALKLSRYIVGSGIVKAEDKAAAHAALTALTS